MLINKFLEETAQEVAKADNIGNFLKDHLDPNSAHLFGFHLPHFELPTYLFFLNNVTDKVTGHSYFQLTANMFMMLISGLIIILLTKLAYKNGKPTKIGHAIEMLVVFVRDDIAISNLGEKRGRSLTPYFLSLFFFILTINYLGMVPGSATPTSNINLTATFAVITLAMMHYQAIKNLGIAKYLKHMTMDSPWGLWIIIVPIEIIGNFFAKPFALAIRLFANMTAGHIIIFGLLSLPATLGSLGVGVISVPMAIFVSALELLVCFLQAFIFTMLSALFIGLMSNDTHSHEESH
jgi:F-type H+-transporting ATPase subunit a